MFFIVSLGFLNLSRKTYKLFLTILNCVIKCKVVGKRINRGLDTNYYTVHYTFFGPGKAVDWAEKSVRKVTDSVEKRAMNCTK